MTVECIWRSSLSASLSAFHIPAPGVLTYATRSISDLLAIKMRFSLMIRWSRLRIAQGDPIALRKILTFNLANSWGFPSIIIMSYYSASCLPKIWVWTIAWQNFLSFSAWRFTKKWKAFPNTSYSGRQSRSALISNSYLDRTCEVNTEVGQDPLLPRRGKIKACRNSEMQRALYTRCRCCDFSTLISLTRCVLLS